jgi:tRNA(fMet)-specific endonuclease VapC
MIEPVFMLDTNIVSDILRNPNGSSAQRARREGVARICLTAIVACELRYGVLKKGATMLGERVEAFLTNIPVMPFEGRFDDDFADIRVGLEKSGTPIGPYDMLIAAHARSLGLTLVTDNVREFSRIEGLKIENWIEREISDAE